MKKYCSFAFALLPLFVSAEIILKSPVANAEISAFAPELKRFLAMPMPEARTFFDDLNERKILNQKRNAVPTRFQWECTDGESGPFEVRFSDRADFGTALPVLILPVKGKTTEVDAVNFEIGRKIHWRISGQKNGKKVLSAVGTFHTASQPPRLLLVPGLSNVRDLGGKRGLDGKTVRQGMIYRSIGLNNNCPEYTSIYKKADAKRRKELAVECKNWKPGKVFLTAAGKNYLDDALKIQTELDLRSPMEIGSMKDSPIGPRTRWINRASKAYKGIYSQSGGKIMAENFRLFCDEKNYPVIFHCIAGADRTGSLAYVLCGVLGVSENELEQDWLITANSSFDREKRYNAMHQKMLTYGKKDDTLAQRIEAYLLSFGITREEIARFRSIMLQ